MHQSMSLDKLVEEHLEEQPQPDAYCINRYSLPKKFQTSTKSHKMSDSERINEFRYSKKGLEAIDLLKLGNRMTGVPSKGWHGSKFVSAGAGHNRRADITSESYMGPVLPVFQRSPQAIAGI